MRYHTGSVFLNYTNNVIAFSLQNIKTLDIKLSEVPLTTPNSFVFLFYFLGSLIYPFLGENLLIGGGRFSQASFLREYPPFSIPADMCVWGQGLDLQLWRLPFLASSHTSPGSGVTKSKAS